MAAWPLGRLADVGVALRDQARLASLIEDAAKTSEIEEALCLRFISVTDQRAILVHWDQGFLKYQRPSRNARKTRAFVLQSDSAQQLYAETLTADASVGRCFGGVKCSAAAWRDEEHERMKLRESKHTFAGRDRVLTLLMLECAELRDWDNSSTEKHVPDTSDRFRASGRYPVR